MGYVSKVVVAAVALAVAGVQVLADTLEVSVTSDYKYTVDVEFYSQDRSAAWPGNNKVWTLADSDAHTFTLQCHSGENICIGAWSRGNSDIYWGVGMDNSQSCTSCCYVCGAGSTDPVTLNN
jgi:hypothetical protein